MRRSDIAISIVHVQPALVQHEAPGVYSKDLIEQIFRQPYCKIQFLERAGMGTRQRRVAFLRRRIPRL